MKTHDYSQYSLEVLTTEDAVAIRGGLTWIGFAVTYVLISALTNPQAHIDAFLEGMNEGRNALQ